MSVGSPGSLLAQLLCPAQHQRGQRRAVLAKLDTNSWSLESVSNEHHGCFEPVKLGEVHPEAISVSSGCQIPQPGGLNNGNLLPHSSGGWKTTIKVLSGLVSGGSSLPSLQTATFSLCPHLTFPTCVEKTLSVSSSSDKDVNPIGFGTTLITSFHPNYLPTGPICKYSHVGGQEYNLWIPGGHNSIRNSSNRELTATE